MCAYRPSWHVVKRGSLLFRIALILHLRMEQCRVGNNVVDFFRVL